MNLDLFNRFSFKSTLLLTIISSCYLIIISLLMGLKPEHLVIVGLYNLLFYRNKTTRSFILGFTSFAIYAIVYDLMKVYPNYLFHDVDIQPLYLFEKQYFGIHINNSYLTLNEFLKLHSSVVLDILSGCFYLCWVPLPLAFGIYLFFKNKRELIYFSFVFLLVNCIGFAFYYLHPAAPPWYIDSYGFVLNYHTIGNPALLTRFDKIFHITLYTTLYTKNSNVFAALPSLHSSYPLIVLLYGMKNKFYGAIPLFSIFCLGIWFSAIYSGHHYLTDVLAGILCALIGYFSFEFVLIRINSIRRVFDNYYHLL